MLKKYIFLSFIEVNDSVEGNFHIGTNVVINYSSLWTKLGLLDASNRNAHLHEENSKFQHRRGQNLLSVTKLLTLLQPFILLFTYPFYFLSCFQTLRIHTTPSFLLSHLLLHSLRFSSHHFPHFPSFTYSHFFLTSTIYPFPLFLISPTSLSTMPLPYPFDYTSLSLSYAFSLPLSLFSLFHLCHPLFSRAGIRLKYLIYRDFFSNLQTFTKN